MSEFEYLESIVFDMDGVLADTEAHGHRVAFNRVFEGFSIPVAWDVPTYGDLLKVSGGKERMRYYFQELGNYPEITDEEIAELHKVKTEEFKKLVRGHALPPRPGTRELLEELSHSDVPFALATTSNEQSANTLLESLFGPDIHHAFTAVLAGDIVKNKKPDPEIYHLAADTLEINPGRSVVVEDTNHGMLAAKAAGFLVCVTVNEYTKDQDFADADIVLSCFGSEEEPCEVIAGPFTPVVPGQFRLQDFDRLVEACS